MKLDTKEPRNPFGPDVTCIALLCKGARFQRVWDPPVRDADCGGAAVSGHCGMGTGKSVDAVIVLSVGKRGELVEESVHVAARAAERSQSAFFLFDGIIAGNLTAFLSVAGTLYETARYSGPVDVGVALTGIEGATSHLLYFQYAGGAEFARPEYRETTRVLAAVLVRDPTAVARRLLERFFRVALRGRFDPFTGQTAA